MATETSTVNELSVTFHPPLYLQRRGWVLDTMRREGVTEVLDIGCGEGELLCCLCNPAPWLAPTQQDKQDPQVIHPPSATAPNTTTPTPSPLLCSCPPSPDDDDDGASTDITDVLAELHRGTLHPVKLAGLDISPSELECTTQFTQPPPPLREPEDTSRAWHTAPVRWEPLRVDVWQGGLEHVNPAFVGVECVVATEVIEHLPDGVLDRFAPVVLGRYHPRLLLLTTPSFTFNARFTAPDAPPEARSGYRDPTGRTERVFRHHDHKFEWTLHEFARWCDAVGEEWGYDVEISGVGKTQEVDEWGRDEELGWASQVAAFRRREGAEWEERRLRRWEGIADLHGTTETSGAHKLLATHQHPVHTAARRPQSLDAIGELVVSRMVYYRETTMTLTEMWFEREVGLACGGWIDFLLRGIVAHNGLALEKTMPGSSDRHEWVIRLAPALHHLILEPISDPWVSPPDTDEVSDPWDPNDDDTTWGADWGNVVVREGDATAEIGDWGMLNALQDDDWGKPEVGWGKDPAGC